jgi:serine/threonine protein kinase
MSLRRFPWKCPKTTDNSFKLFITQPTEEELSHPLYPQRQPPKSESTTPSHTSSGNTDYETLSQQQRPSQPSIAETENKDNQSTASVTTATIASSTTSVPAPSQNITLKGPWRLLRLLPRETRHIIGRMLELDPTKRATLEEITADPWVTKSPFCRQEVTGQVIFAAGHTHILEGGAGGS